MNNKMEDLSPPHLPRLVDCTSHQRESLRQMTDMVLHIIPIYPAPETHLNRPVLVPTFSWRPPQTVGLHEPES